MDHPNPVPARSISPTDTLINGLVGGMYLLADTILLPATFPPLAQVSAVALASAHLVYGGLLGALTRA